MEKICEAFKIDQHQAHHAKDDVESLWTVIKTILAKHGKLEDEAIFRTLVEYCIYHTKPTIPTSNFKQELEKKETKEEMKSYLAGFARNGLSELAQSLELAYSGTKEQITVRILDHFFDEEGAKRPRDHRPTKKRKSSEAQDTVSKKKRSANPLKRNAEEASPSEKKIQRLNSEKL